MSVRVTCEQGVEIPCLGVEKGRKIDGQSAEGKVMRLGWSEFNISLKFRCPGVSVVFLQVLRTFMPKMATLSNPLLGFRMIMADISTEIDVWRSALIGRMRLCRAVLLIFGGSAYPSRQTTSVTTLLLFTFWSVRINRFPLLLTTKCHFVILSQLLPFIN